MSIGFYNKQMRNNIKKGNFLKNCANTVKRPFALEDAQHAPRQRKEFSACLVSAFGVEAKYTEVKAFNSTKTSFFVKNAPPCRILFQDILDTIYDLFISPKNAKKGQK